MVCLKLEEQRNASKDNDVKLVKAQLDGLITLIQAQVVTLFILCTGFLPSLPVSVYASLLSYTIKRCLCICTNFVALSRDLLTNRLAQTRKICINCSINFSWSSKHIF